MIRSGVSKLTSSDDTSKDQEPDKYRLLVTAGPAYDTAQHVTVPVNGTESVTISNDFITAKVKVRVRGYRGLPSGSPKTNVYFEDPVHNKDQYSLAFSFVPKQDIPSLDTVWGNDFDHPVRDRLPPGFNTAFRIVKEFIDPGLSCDAYADEPWLYGPSLSCWFAFRIGDKIKDGEDFPAPDDQDVMRDGADGSGQKIRAELGLPENNEKRRKFFLDAENRKKLVFEKGRVYQADFYNPYLDFGNLALKLPGFSIKVFKYIDAKSHCLRYVFKNRETGDMYLNVNFNLLWGDKLKETIAKEGQPDDSAPSKSSANEPAKPDAEEAAHAEADSNDVDKHQLAVHDEERTDVSDKHPSTTSEDDEAGTDTHGQVSEISKLLQQTATADKTDELTDILD